MASAQDLYQAWDQQQFEIMRMFADLKNGARAPVDGREILERILPVSRANYKHLDKISDPTGERIMGWGPGQAPSDKLLKFYRVFNQTISETSSWLPALISEARKARGSPDEREKLLSELYIHFLLAMKLGSIRADEQDSQVWRDFNELCAKDYVSVSKIVSKEGPDWRRHTSGIPSHVLAFVPPGKNEAFQKLILQDFAVAWGLPRSLDPYLLQMKTNPAYYAAGQFKYTILATVASQISQYIKTNILEDSFIKRMKENVYYIISLYSDDYKKLDGSANYWPQVATFHHCVAVKIGCELSVLGALRARCEYVWDFFKSIPQFWESSKETATLLEGAIRCLDRCVAAVPTIQTYAADSRGVGHRYGRFEVDGWCVDPKKQDQANHMWFGPYATVPGYGPYAADTGLIPAGLRLVTFRLMIDEVRSNNDAVLTIEVSDSRRNASLAGLALTRWDFIKPNEYQDFSLCFLAERDQILEFRTWWHGNCVARQKSVMIR